MQKETGVIHGRFQVLHLKHMEYVLAAKMRCKKLFIGIVNPDDLYMADSPNDEEGSKKEANPFTYYERFQMIHDALLDFGVKREEFEIVPFPMNRPDYILQYAPKDATYYMSISSEWGEERLKILTALGLDVEVLWRKSEEEKGTTSAEVRELIVKGEEWRQLVPKTVYEYIQEHNLEERIKKLSK